MISSSCFFLSTNLVKHESRYNERIYIFMNEQRKGANMYNNDDKQYDGGSTKKPCRQTMLQRRMFCENGCLYIYTLISVLMMLMMMV